MLRAGCSLPPHEQGPFEAVVFATRLRYHLTLLQVLGTYEEMVRVVDRASRGAEDARLDALVPLDLTTEAARGEFPSTVRVAAAAVALRMTGFEGLRE